MKEKNEILIQAEVINAIRKLGHIAERRVPYEGGMSDVVASVSGRWVAIEIKTPAGHLTPLQAAYRDKIKASGNLYAVCRSKEDAIALVERIKNGTSDSEPLSTPI